MTDKRFILVVFGSYCIPLEGGKKYVVAIAFLECLVALRSGY
ncbi:MAG TPA: hypothetical protein V6C84_18640 [Coleofasciculaceae cyanobacterium]